MGNHTYIFSERLFHKEKDSKTKEFLAGTEIDLDDVINSESLTIQKIIEILPSLSYELVNEEILNGEKDEWQCAIHKNGELKIWLIVTEFVDFETEVDTIEVGRGSDDESAIEIFLALTPVCGKFLYYCDTGMMASISEGNSVEGIYKKFRE
jgi:hypothetical protein